MDGSTDFPAYLLKGQRKVDFTITYWPQNIGGLGSGDGTQGILYDMINSLGLNTVAHSFIVKNYDTGATYTITGCIATTVQINGKTGQALEVQVVYQGQNIATNLPVGTNFNSDPGAPYIPFYFSQESVIFSEDTSPVAMPQSLTFNATITNNLNQVPQFGTDVLRSIATLTRKADGTLTATFADVDDYPGETNIFPDVQVGATNTPPYSDPTGVDPSEPLSTTPTGLNQQTIRLVLGTKGLTTYYLDYTGAVVPKVDLTNPIADLTAVALDWTATGASVHI
jgi:hypothetical protein